MCGRGFIIGLLKNDFAGGFDAGVGSKFYGG
jgi:hypothetical protein